MHGRNVHKLNTYAVENFVHLLVDILQWRTRDKFLIRMLGPQFTHDDFEWILVFLEKIICAVLRSECVF